MKDLGMLVWITQLGMSVAAPLAGFTLLGVWLRKSLGVGVWVVIVLTSVGLISAVSSFKHTLSMLDSLERKKDGAASESFNKHE